MKQYLSKSGMTRGPHLFKHVKEDDIHHFFKYVFTLVFLFCLDYW